MTLPPLYEDLVDRLWEALHEAPDTVPIALISKGPAADIIKKAMIKVHDWLDTTHFDTHWIAGNRVADAVRFGPSRFIFFYLADNKVRKTVFADLDQLAVTLCFG